MKLLIDISEYNAEYIRNTYRVPQDINMVIAEAIINGKQISTPHGRLIDANELKSKFRHGNGDDDADSAWISTIRRFITQADTIIEAEGSEK